MTQTTFSTGPRTALLLTPEYAPYAWGGLATYVHQITAGLTAQGTVVDVVVSPTYANAVNVVGPPGLPPALVISAHDAPELQLSTIRRTWGRRYDVAYVQDSQAARLAALLVEHGLCGRVVAAAHLPSYSGFSYFDRPEDDARQQSLEALLYRHSHCVVVPSEFASDVLLRVHRLDPEDIAVIPLGAPELGDADRRDCDDAALDVLCVGRIAKQKGLEDLCAIADGVAPEIARFTHIGSARAGEDRRALARTSISQLGYRLHPEVITRLRSADIVLSTSMYETFGLALLEGMAAGAVPVAFRCGALLELIDHDTSGVLVAPGDVRGAIDAIHELHHDRLRLQRLAAGATAAAARFSWEAHLAELTLVLFGR